MAGRKPRRITICYKAKSTFITITTWATYNILQFLRLFMYATKAREEVTDKLTKNIFVLPLGSHHLLSLTILLNQTQTDKFFFFFFLFRTSMDDPMAKSYFKRQANLLIYVKNIDRILFTKRIQILFIRLLFHVISYLSIERTCFDQNVIVLRSSDFGIPSVALHIMFSSFAHNFLQNCVRYHKNQKYMILILRKCNYWYWMIFSFTNLVIFKSFTSGLSSIYHEKRWCHLVNLYTSFILTLQRPFCLKIQS